MECGYVRRAVLEAAGGGMTHSESSSIGVASPLNHPHVIADLAADALPRKVRQ